MTSLRKQVLQIALSVMKAQFKSNRMEDIQKMKTKANKITDESLESTRRMLEMVDESQKNGAATMIELDKQGKQLKDVEENMEEIKENMKTAQRNLNELSKGWCCCICPCNRLKTIENDWRYKPVWGTKQKDMAVVTAGSSKSVRSASGPYIKRITNDAREDEMEENLEQVGSMIGNLKKMAIGMNSELDTQNQTIDRITDKVEITTHHVDAATKKAKKIFK